MAQINFVEIVCLGGINYLNGLEVSIPARQIKGARHGERTTGSIPWGVFRLPCVRCVIDVYDEPYR